MEVSCHGVFQFVCLTQEEVLISVSDLPVDDRLLFLRHPHISRALHDRCVKEGSTAKHALGCPTERIGYFDLMLEGLPVVVVLVGVPLRETL